MINWCAILLVFQVDPLTNWPPDRISIYIISAILLGQLAKVLEIDIMVFAFWDMPWITRPGGAPIPPAPGCTGVY
jgi:hypothetical protein